MFIALNHFQYCAPEERHVSRNDYLLSAKMHDKQNRLTHNTLHSYGARYH